MNRINRFEQYTKVREACRGIVIKNDKILLTYEVNTDQWFIPGGGLENNESVEECYIRELAEETGCVVDAKKQFLTINEYYAEWLFVSHYFICDYIGETERKLTNREIEVGLEPRWISLNEAIEIFSKHQDYADENEMKRGAYLREYNADFERSNGGTILFPTNSTTTVSDADMLWLTGPVTIDVTTRLMNCNVQFNANGGSGAMTAQTYSYGEAQALIENSFSKTGYTFAGWNTKADGTGTAYIDKQSVTFTPVNDGDDITLYAQWTACNHAWTDGECTECGAVCSHSGGTATCTEQATCTDCGMKYGDLEKHKVVYTSSENIISEICKNNCGYNETATVNAPIGTHAYDGTEKKATVSYSDGWHGGELSVTYSDDGNINAGKVTASIEKDSVKANVEYTIDKMNPNYIIPNGLTATYGQTLADIVLHEGWTWDEPTASVGDTGTNSFKAIFIPANTTNYNTASADVDVTVSKAVVTITVDNKTANQYEEMPQFTFTATGLIQGETLITNPTISTQTDMKSAGAFEIIASGADAGHNYTITYVPGTLTVEAYTYENDECTICEAIDPNYDSETVSPNTGDNTQMWLWWLLLMVSATALAALTFIRRQQNTASQ